MIVAISENSNIFCQRLAQIRESHNENQQQLADSIGITQQTLSRYESGERTPNIDILVKIAKHYNVSTDYLLGLTDVVAKDMSIDSISRKVGLSESTVESLIKFKPVVYGDFSKWVLNAIISNCLSSNLIISITSSIFNQMMRTEVLDDSVEAFCKINGINETEKADEIRTALNDIEIDMNSFKIILPQSCLETDDKNIYLRYVDFLQTPINENGFYYRNSLCSKNLCDYFFRKSFEDLSLQVLSEMRFNEIACKFVKDSLKCTKQANIDEITTSEPL